MAATACGRQPGPACGQLAKRTAAHGRRPASFECSLGHILAAVPESSHDRQAIREKKGWSRVFSDATALSQRARNWAIGSDPGLLRLRMASRTTAALATALLILFLLTRATHQPLTVALLGVLITMTSSRSI